MADQEKNGARMNTPDLKDFLADQYRQTKEGIEDIDRTLVRLMELQNRLKNHLRSIEKMMHENDKTPADYR